MVPFDREAVLLTVVVLVGEGGVGPTRLREVQIRLEGVTLMMFTNTNEL